MRSKTLTTLSNAWITPLSLCLTLLLLTGCEMMEDLQPAPKAKVYYGPETAIGEGTARMWVKMSKNGRPLSTGVDISDEALASLPEEGQAYHLQGPKEAENTLYKMVMLDWNPGGHAPDPIYTLPHFDIHFYMTTKEEVAKITGGMHPHTPEFAEKYMPASYITGVPLPNMGMAVPGMGVHWVDVNAPEFGGETFTKTFIYGSYNNKVIFHEPMITVAYLNSLTPNMPVVTPIPQPAHVQVSGYHPQAYTVLYDPTPGVYTVALTDMRYRKAE